MASRQRSLKKPPFAAWQPGTRDRSVVLRNWHFERLSVVERLLPALVRAVGSVRQNALTRTEYKNAIEGCLTSAFLYFVELALAAANGLTKADRWKYEEMQREVEFELPIQLLHSVQGFADRRQAVAAALKSLRKDETYNRKLAANWLMKSRVKTVRPLPRDATKAFFAWVETVVDEVFLAEEIHPVRTARKARTSAARNKPKFVSSGK